MKRSNEAIFKDAINGYGFDEVEQTPDGVYCTGCYTVHKRPTKMYTNGRDTMCKFAIIKYYDPENP